MNANSKCTINELSSSLGELPGSPHTDWKALFNIKNSDTKQKLKHWKVWRNEIMDSTLFSMRSAHSIERCWTAQKMMWTKYVFKASTCEISICLSHPPSALLSCIQFSLAQLNSQSQPFPFIHCLRNFFLQPNCFYICIQYTGWVDTQLSELVLRKHLLLSKFTLSIVFLWLLCISLS